MKVDNMHCTSKHYFATGRRHHDEVYNTTMAPNAKHGAAWLRVDDKRESLIWASSPAGENHVIVSNTYVLDPVFVSDTLVWCQGDNSDWNLGAVRIIDGEPDKPLMPFQTVGRARALQSAEGEGSSALVWEERTGKQTVVRLSFLQNGKFSDPITLSDGTYNVYDPAVCFRNDGNVAVAWSAFRCGQYIIESMAADTNGQIIDAPRRVSNQTAPALYPSLCTRPEGGVWVSFTALDGLQTEADNTLLQHLRYKSQRNIFNAPGQVYCGAIDADGQILAPLTPWNLELYQGYVAAMIVNGATDAGRSRVFLDANGSPNILYRQYRSVEEPVYEDADPPLERSENRGVTNKERILQPNLSLASLRGHVWYGAEPLLKNAYIDIPIALRVQGNQVAFAFHEDSRRTGWARQAEYHDHEGQLAVGIAEIELEQCDEPMADMITFHLAPQSPPSIENPDIEMQPAGDYMAAFGQTHTHSNLSVCFRAFDRDSHFNYRFAQDVQHCDFCGVTDHTYNMWHAEMLIVRKLADYYYFPGEFIAIPAYEWTGSHGLSHEGGPWGHYNPLYLEESGDLEFYTPVDPDCPGGSLRRMWEAYAGKQIIAVPHHVADHMHPINWEAVDTDYVPVIELFQDGRGSAEQEGADGVSNSAKTRDDHWALTQLKNGKRFGFIAGGDHRGIALAGAWLKEKTRTGLYKALNERHCFATTGQRIGIDFKCNDKPMGTSLEVTAARFDLHIQSPEPIHNVHIIKNGETVETIASENNRLVHEWQANDISSSDFWYIRVVLDNGEVGWSSPIWFD
jgi:hypothetical protein